MGSFYGGGGGGTQGPKGDKGDPGGLIEAEVKSIAEAAIEESDVIKSGGLKTINGQSLVGGGNIVIEGGGGGTAEGVLTVDIPQYPTAGFTGGKYWSKTGVWKDGTGSESLARVSSMSVEQGYDVTPGQTWYLCMSSIAAASTTTDLSYGVYLDADGNFVSEVFPEKGFPWGTYNAVTTVPENAVKMCLNSWGGNGAYYLRRTLNSKEKNCLAEEVKREKHISEMKEIQAYSRNVLRPTYSPNEKAYFTFVHDDGHITAEVDALFYEKGVPLCLAAINEGATMLLRKNWDSVIAHGGEIIAHYGTPIEQSTLEDYDAMYDRFVGTKVRFQRLGYDVNGIIAAGGNTAVYNTETQDMWCRANYLYSDLYGLSNAGSTKGNTYKQSRNNFGNLFLRIADEETQKAKVKEAIDKAVKNKERNIWYFHNWSEAPKNVVEYALDYIASLGTDVAEIVTYKQYYDTHVCTESKFIRTITATKAMVRYATDSVVDYSDITVTANYSDGTKEVVTASHGTLDQSNVGLKFLPITYGVFKTYIPIEVVAAGRYLVIGDANNGWSLYSDGIVECHSIAAWSISVKNAPDWTETYRDNIRAVVLYGLTSNGNSLKYQNPQNDATIFFENFNLEYVIAPYLSNVMGGGTPGLFKNTTINNVVSYQDDFMISYATLGRASNVTINNWYSAGKIVLGGVGIWYGGTIKNIYIMNSASTSAADSLTVSNRNIYVPWTQGGNTDFVVNSGTVIYDWTPAYPEFDPELSEDNASLLPAIS